MIPPKLYLPTSTLNFNNIMSSESVSPATFYANRRFGYKRFDKVAPNSLVNLILLYGKYPVFSINDQGLENYPLVIEISTQSMPEDFFEEKDGIFYTSKTIYFNPFSTRIIFRTEEERTASLSKAEPSVESKLIPLYQGRLVVLPDDVETFEWGPTIINDLPIYDNYAVSSDIAINKLKGMLYGYLLGANESSSKEIVALKRMVKDLRNVLSAVLTSPDGRATHFQQQQLDNLYAGINQAFYALSGAQSRINEVISQKIECYKAPTFVEILKGEGLYQEWFKKQVSQLSLRYYQITPFYLSYQPTDKVSELDRYIDNIERMIQTYDVKTKLDISKLPIIQNRHVVEVPEQKEFLPVLFNGYMDEVWNGTEFLSSRYEFAKVGGKLFKESSGDKWENSPARTYINSLLKNLNEYTEFDINSTDSDILKSFAAFCQKGDSDIDKLREYLISNGIGDFRIAFALWGLVFGFAEMPKTLTNELFEDQDDHYLSECYKSIYKQLHAIELQGILDRTQKEEKPMGILQGIKEFGRKVVESLSGKSVEQIQEVHGSIVQGQPEREVGSIPEELMLVFGSEAFKKLSLQAQQYFKTESLKLYTGNIDNAYIEALKKLEYPKSQRGWKQNWKDARKVLTQRQKREKQKADITLLFPNEDARPSNQFFYLDKGAFDCLLPVLPNDKKILEQFKIDLDWFQNNYHETYFDEKRGQTEGIYRNNPKDNASVIENFERVLKRKLNNPKAPWLRDVYNKIDINMVINKLKELYR